MNNVDRMKRLFILVSTLTLATGVGCNRSQLQTSDTSGMGNYPNYTNPMGNYSWNTGTSANAELPVNGQGTQQQTFANGFQYPNIQQQQQNNLYTPPNVTVPNYQTTNTTFVMWTAERCNTVDSLPNWTGGAEVNTAKGRMDWAVQNLPQYAAYYAQAQQHSVDANGNPIQLYPTFGILQADGSETFDPTYNPAAMPPGRAPSDPMSAIRNIPPTYTLVAFCIASCYHQEVPVHFASLSGDFDYHKDVFGYAIAEAAANLDKSKFGVVTANFSDSHNPSFAVSPIDHFTWDLKTDNPLKQKFYFIRTEHDRPGEQASLVVTENHGLVDEAGNLRTAKHITDSFIAGKHEKLWTASGEKVLITDIQVQELPDRAYNLSAPPNSKSHLVLAGGSRVLAADGYLQLEMNGNDFMNYLNATLRRDNIPAVLVK